MQEMIRGQAMLCGSKMQKIFKRSGILWHCNLRSNDSGERNSCARIMQIQARRERLLSSSRVESCAFEACLMRIDANVAGRQRLCSSLVSAKTAVPVNVERRGRS